MGLSRDCPRGVAITLFVVQGPTPGGSLLRIHRGFASPEARLQPRPPRLRHATI